MSGRKPMGYLASPVRPEGSETYESNRTLTYCYRAAMVRFGCHVITPYVAENVERDDPVPELREAGIQRALKYVTQSDYVVACGPRVSAGMQREMDHARELGRPVIDLTGKPLWEWDGVIKGVLHDA